MATKQASENFDKPINPKLIAILALRQHHLNQALGIRRVTPHVAALLNAYNKLIRQNVQSVVTASIAHALLGKDQDRMLEIMTEVQGANTEQKRVLLAEAETLQERSKQYVQVLEKGISCDRTN